MLPIGSMALELPDKELTEYFLEKYVAAIAMNMGLDPTLLHPHLFKAAVDAIDDFDVSDGRLAALEKALKKSKEGQFQIAARLIRSLASEGAESMAIADQLVREAEKNLRGPIAGAEKSARERKEALRPRNDDIKEQAESLASSGRNPATIKKILSERTGLSTKQVGRILYEK